MIGTIGKMNYTRDPKPEILRIEELVTQVKVGDIKLPKFQRPFVWKRGDILTLWDSVYKGYPIGSILLWLTSEKLASERKIGDLEINTRPEEYPTNYLLDGQQRLSSLCGGLYWDGTDPKSKWNIFFDLNEEVFLYSEEYRLEFFPLNKLLETFDFINQCKTFEAHSKRNEYERKANKLLKAVKDYKIAAVRIGEMKMDEVAPIFERINSTGRQLTIVDLMRAATWSGGFDLNDAIANVRASLETKHFEDVPESHILRNIAAACELGVNKEDIEKLRFKTSSDLLAAAESCVEAYCLAVDFLTSELPLTSYAYLPYALQLTLLVEFFRIRKSPDIHQRMHLRRWFWRTSFGRHFGVSNTGQNAKDLNSVREYARGVAAELDFGKEVKMQQFVLDEFRLNKASSKSLALLLAERKPRSLLDGSLVNTFQVLSVVNRHEYHHIFPKAFLTASGLSGPRIDAHANICMLVLSNNRAISDSRPSMYFPLVEQKLGPQLAEVLHSNYITDAAFNAAVHENYDEFLQQRGAALGEGVKRLCELGE